MNSLPYVWSHDVGHVTGREIREPLCAVVNVYISIAPYLYNGILWYCAVKEMVSFYLSQRGICISPSQIEWQIFSRVQKEQTLRRSGY